MSDIKWFDNSTMTITHIVRPHKFPSPTFELAYCGAYKATTGIDRVIFSRPELSDQEVMMLFDNPDQPRLCKTCRKILQSERGL